jgi:hypothetical protein
MKLTHLGNIKHQLLNKEACRDQKRKQKWANEKAGFFIQITRSSLTGKQDKNVVFDKVLA